MASLAAEGRLMARLASRKRAPHVVARGFQALPAVLAAQKFTMAALSLTMTEGNIAAWRVKEGGNFSAGDVLLEIETDKTTMDVEAQEDGFMMKILQGDGSKSVAVGTHIAVLAEPADDLSALEIPVGSSPKPNPKGNKAAPPAPETSSATKQPRMTGPGTPNQKYPLYPSVQHLLEETGLASSVISDMTATGPNGRLLKGDVLAYLGRIKANIPLDISARFEKATHLDLSNIKIAKASEPKKTRKDPAAPAAPVQETTVVSTTVSLLDARRKLFGLGFDLGHDQLVAGAAGIANKALPVAPNYKPSTDELFDEILGLAASRPKVSWGRYKPTSKALSPAGSKASEGDIIEILASKSLFSVISSNASSVAANNADLPSQFELVVPTPEKNRAEVFLSRFKSVLEMEPEKIVLWEQRERKAS